MKYELLIILIIIPSDWEFVGGTLSPEINGTALSTGKGLLSVIFIHRHTREKINRTVCADDFNWRTANIFCQYFGYNQGKWGSQTQRLNMPKFVPR